MSTQSVGIEFVLTTFLMQWVAVSWACTQQTATQTDPGELHLASFATDRFYLRNTQGIQWKTFKISPTR